MTTRAEAIAAELDLAFPRDRGASYESLVAEDLARQSTYVRGIRDGRAVNIWADGSYSSWTPRIA